MIMSVPFKQKLHDDSRLRGWLGGGVGGGGGGGLVWFCCLARSRTGNPLLLRNNISNPPFVKDSRLEHGK